MCGTKSWELEQAAMGSGHKHLEPHFMWPIQKEGSLCWFFALAVKLRNVVYLKSKINFFLRATLNVLNFKTLSRYVFHLKYDVARAGRLCHP